MARNDQAVRLLKLAKILADSRRGLPLKTLSERYNWPLRALYRDIDALESIGFPVIHEEGRFRLPANSFHGPPEQIQPDERIALFAARQLASGIKQTTVGRALDRLWNRLSGARPGSPLLLPTDTPGAVSVRSPLAIDYGASGRVIATIESALIESRAISCRYEALSTGELSARVVEPGALHWDPALEALYLIGWCRLRNDLRIFAVQRFRMVSLLAEKISRRPECASSSALRQAFRIWRGGHVQKISVHLRGWAAREARERKLHASQELTRLPGGGVRISLEVAGFEEAIRWILSYGALATVESPPALVEQVRAEIERTAAAYPERSVDVASSRRLKREEQM